MGGVTDNDIQKNCHAMPPAVRLLRARRREGLELGPVSITVSVVRASYFSQSIVWLHPFRTQFLVLQGPTGERKAVPDLGRSYQEIYDVNENELIKQGWLDSSAD